jgi:holo-[acyl-carrier protein] synthase
VSGVGLDLLEIERLEAALARRPNLAERLFTPAEREYAAARTRPAQHLAARFCAKEAVAKALALEAWSWRDIEVVSPAAGGPPRIVLHGELAARGVEIDVSLTHSRGTAGAVAMVRR